MAKLGPYELNSIITGDARELSKAIPDNSVDLIFTDPVYDRIEDYEWLAETAARVLKGGGNLIVQSAHFYLNKIYPSMDKFGLNYVWTIAQQLWGKNAAIFKYRIIACWKPYLWYSKGNRDGKWVMDWIVSGNKNKNTHEWGDSPEMFINLIDRLCSEDQIIFDPFTGGGTVPAVCKMLNRQYLAFEIDPETADLARQRVANTQPPLPIVWPEQLGMDLLPPSKVET